MSSFVIKLIAIISMICDHTSDALIGHLSFWNIIGRVAFPLFCFQLVIGYKHTRNIEKYLLRLFLFGLISQVPFSLFIYSFTGNLIALNIFFTLAIGLLAIYALDKLPNKWLAIFIDLVLILLAEVVKVDYGGFGICLILCIFVFYKDKYIETTKNKETKNIKSKNDSNDFLAIFKNNFLFTFVFFILCFIRFFVYFKTLDTYIVIAEILGTFFPIIFMLLYNGKKGPSLKYFFYAFYPIHLVILVVLHYLL